MIRLLILIAFMLILPLNGIMQNITENHTKYWFYRKRLTDYFIKVGEGKGESNVANTRNEIIYGTSRKNIRFADQGVALGWYIGVLATEYKLLKDNNQPIDQTSKELFYALKAFKQMDLWDNEIDGFFSRRDSRLNDDSDFNIEGRNKNLALSDIHGTKPLGHPTYIDEFTTESDGSITQTHPMSQDQAIHLIMGFALINKCIGNDQFLTINGETIYFKQEARNNVDRIINYIKEKPNLAILPWTIYNKEFPPEKVERGADSELFAL